MSNRAAKIQTNMRLTPLCRALLVQLAEVYGTAQSDIVEILSRAEAARLNLSVDGQKQTALKAGPPILPRVS